MWIKTIQFVIILNIYSVINAECPKPEFISPCNCINNRINCGGNKDIKLKAIFESLSNQLPDGKKQFAAFNLNNTAIHEIEENVFSDITFTIINIESASNLSLIHTNALTHNNDVTKNVYISLSPVENSPPNHDIFNMLSQLKNVNTIGLFSTKIKEIPSLAFKSINGSLDKLTYISFANNKLNKIADKAFYDLRSLTGLDLFNTSLQDVSPDAFRFSQESNASLHLTVDSSLVNGANIDKLHLVNINRPITLDISCEKSSCLISYLDEKNLSLFLDKNVKNQILLNSIPVDCTDCRSFWVQKYSLNSNKLARVICSNNKPINDSDNFKNCTA